MARHPEPGPHPGDKPHALDCPAGHGFPGQLIFLQDLNGYRLGSGEKSDVSLVGLLKLLGHGDAREQVTAGAAAHNHHPGMHD